MKPILSIIVSIYNVEKQLRRCLESLLQQGNLSYLIGFVRKRNLRLILQSAFQDNKEERYLMALTYYEQNKPYLGKLRTSTKRVMEKKNLLLLKSYVMGFQILLGIKRFLQAVKFK